MGFTNRMVLPLTSAYVRTDKPKKTTTTPVDVSCYNKESEEVINIPFQSVVEATTPELTTSEAEVTYSAASTLKDDEVAIVNSSTGQIDVVKDEKLASKIAEVTTQKPVVKAQVKKPNAKKPNNARKPQSSKKK